MGEKIIAVDLGGTNLRTALVINNKVLCYNKKSTPKNADVLVEELFNSISEFMSNEVKGIGIACPGPLKNGMIQNPPNLALKNFDLKKAVKKKFKIKVEVENDAKCVALAESKLGCKKKNFIILTLGTGIGGGIIINKKLYRGTGYAGELGHIIIDNGKDLEKLWQNSKKLTAEEFGNALTINELIEINNEESKKILEETAKYLGQGIASLIVAFDPEIVILTGGLKETGNTFLDIIKKYVKEYCILPKETPIDWTRLEHPGTMGASLLIR
ncbi:MAG: ROK family protein [Nanoarchaeota archaeon]